MRWRLMHRYLLVSDILAGSGSPRDPPVIRAVFPFSEKSFDTSTLGVSESGMIEDDVIANEVHKCTTCTRLGCLFRRAAGAGWGMGQLLGISRGLPSCYYILPIRAGSSTLYSIYPHSSCSTALNLSLSSTVPT
jgi:hypothetical protein